jgi:hypothetical protein
MSQNIIDTTIKALFQVRNPRFFRTERGYQGQFYCALQTMLERDGWPDECAVLEMEYQKSQQHNIYQRPDIVLHIPAEDYGLHIWEGNFSVYALKHSSKTLNKKKGLTEIELDFQKLDEMFRSLQYPIGCFINIDSDQPLLQYYSGPYWDRIHAFAVRLVNDLVQVHYSYFDANGIQTYSYED